MRLLFVLLAVLAQKEHHLRGDGWQYYCLGNCLSSTSSIFPTTSYSLTPGRILMGGGTDVDDAYKWLIANSDNGNVVVFRADNDDLYNPYIYGLGKLNSITTLVLSKEKASYDPFVLEVARSADGIWFAGGDQWQYCSYWNETALNTVFNDRIKAGASCGGTSAGMAIQAGWIYTAEYDTVYSNESLANPFDKHITLARGFLAELGSWMENVITDMHFHERDRMGRLVTFLARLGTSFGVQQPRGVACDEATALLIDADGIGTVVQQNGTTVFTGCYILQPQGPAQVCQKHVPLTFLNIQTTRLSPGDTFDFNTWSSPTGFVYTLNAINGTLSSVGNDGNIY